MNRRLRARLASLIACLLAATSFSLGTAAPATAAFGDETFGCRVSPGTVLEWRTFCMNNVSGTTYNAGFAVLNTSGSYTYSWNISGSYVSVFTGCTSTSHDCALWMRAGQAVSVTVTFSQNGQSATRWAHASIEPFCGNQYC